MCIEHSIVLLLMSMDMYLDISNDKVITSIGRPISSKKSSRFSFYNSRYYLWYVEWLKICLLITWNNKSNPRIELVRRTDDRVASLPEIYIRALIFVNYESKTGSNATFQCQMEVLLRF